MELYEVLRTTFAAREFTAEPVPDEVLARILDQARFAPSGGNRQGWRVIVVRNPVTKRALADLSAFAAQRYAAQVVCVDVKVVASMDQDLGRVGIISGASIYPFAWNILPASRHEGLGGTITTLATAREPEIQALLGIPPHIAVCAVMPLGRPTRTLSRLKRKAVAEFTTRERWNGPSFGSPAQ